MRETKGTATRKRFDFVTLLIGLLAGVACFIVWDTLIRPKPFVGYTRLDHVALESGYSYNNTQHDDVEMRLLGVDTARGTVQFGVRIDESILFGATTQEQVLRFINYPRGTWERSADDTGEGDPDEGISD